MQQKNYFRLCGSLINDSRRTAISAPCGGMINDSRLTAKTIDSWNYHDLLKWFIEVCWNRTASQYAAALLQLQSIRLANHFSTRCIDFSALGMDDLTPIKRTLY